MEYKFTKNKKRILGKKVIKFRSQRGRWEQEKKDFENREKVI